MGHQTKTGWWFGTFFYFPFVGNHHPNWLIFFRGVQTTNQKTFWTVRKSVSSQRHSKVVIDTGEEWWAEGIGGWGWRLDAIEVASRLWKIQRWCRLSDVDFKRWPFRAISWTKTLHAHGDIDSQPDSTNIASTLDSDSPGRVISFDGSYLF